MSSRQLDETLGQFPGSPLLQHTPRDLRDVLLDRIASVGVRGLSDTEREFADTEGLSDMCLDFEDAAPELRTQYIAELR